MSEVKVASTTDTPEAVDAAAEMLESDTLIQPAEEGSGGEGRSSFEATETWTEKSGPRVASTTDSEEAVAEVQEDLDEDREQKKEQYLGKTRRKLLHKVSRLHSELDERDRKIDELQQQLSRRDDQQQPGNGEVQRAPTEDELLRAEAEYWAHITLPHRQELAALKYPDFDEVTRGVEVPREILDWRQSFFPVVLPHSRMLPNKTHAFRPRKLLSGDGGLGQGDGV